MFRTFRHMLVSTTAKSTGAAFLAALILASPAAADELMVKNNADVPVRIVVKNGGNEVGRADRIDKKSSGKVTLNPGVSLAKITPSVEATPLGVSTRCFASKSGSQYEVKCDAVASAPAAMPAGGATGVQTGQQTGLETISVTITNQSEVPVTVKFKDAANGEFTTFVKEKSSQSAGRVKIDKSKQITWEATYNSKQCAVGIVAETINVTKCGPQLQQGSAGGCSLNDVGKDGCPSKAVLEQRRLRTEKEGQLRSAEEDLKRNLDAAKTAKTKADIEKALKQADDARRRVNIFKRELGELQPAEKINYTSTLPKEYQEKNPFDIVYDNISRTLCRGGKAQWDGSIVSCQKGDTPDHGNRPIAPATDISPNNPNANR